MDFAFEQKWKTVCDELSKQFGSDLELDAIIFLIGVQELGQGFRKFSKDEKLHLMHIAVCKLLEPYGHYEFTGMDDDGWPHYRKVESLPPLIAKEQELLMKRAIIEYFDYSST
jgi:hypothetical protein